MRALKRIVNGTSAAVLTLSSLMTIGFTGVAHAAAQTCTWTGTNTNNMKQNGNWANCGGSYPQAGDNIILTTTSGPGGPITLTNDLGVALGNVTVQNDGTSATTYLNINTLTLANGATIDASGGTENGSGGFTGVTVTSVTAQGSLTITNETNFTITNCTVNGAVTLGNESHFFASDVAPAGVTVQKGAYLTFNPSTTNASTSTYPITLGGGSGTAAPELDFFAVSGQATTWSFANPITLLSDASIWLPDPNVTVNQTGSITGPGFVLGLDTQNSHNTSKVVFNPSSNNSNTVAGTQQGGNANVGGAGGSGGTGNSSPGTPDTGFAVLSAHPVTSLVVASMAAIGIALIASRLKAENKRH